MFDVFYSHADIQANEIVGSLLIVLGIFSVSILKAVGYLKWEYVYLN